jgi:hypothetical protein
MHQTERRPANGVGEGPIEEPLGPMVGPQESARGIEDHDDLGKLREQPREGRALHRRGVPVVSKWLKSSISHEGPNGRWINEFHEENRNVSRSGEVFALTLLWLGEM